MRFSIMPRLAACAVGLLLAGSAFAQGPKIGVINFQKAVLDTAEIQKVSADLQAKYKPRQDALVKAQQELSDIQTQFNNSQGKLSSAGEAELQSKGQRKKLQVDRMTQDLQEEFEGERDEALRRAGARMQEVLKKLADEKGLDLIVDEAAAMFKRDTLDVTPAATAAYDKAYPAK